MVQEIKIRCKNNKKTLQLPIGSTLWDAYHALNLQMPYGPVSAKVNNKVEGLHYRFYNDKDVEFLDVTSSSGMRTYTRSLFFRVGKSSERFISRVCVAHRDAGIERVLLRLAYRAADRRG